MNFCFIVLLYSCDTFFILFIYNLHKLINKILFLQQIILRDRSSLDFLFFYRAVIIICYQNRFGKEAILLFLHLIVNFILLSIKDNRLFLYTDLCLYFLLRFIQLKKPSLMGNSTPQKNISQVDLYINHSQFLNARLISTNNQNFIKITTSMQEKEYNAWAETLLKYHKSTSKIMLPVKHFWNKAGLCGELGSIEILYPNYPYLLSNEIYDRKGKKHVFSEQELWYLLFSLSKAKKQNEINSNIIGDIRPKTIFLNEEGSIKVPNSDSWPYEKSKIAKALSNITTYLAPEQVKSILQNEKEFSKFDQVGQIFSIGLTLLSVGNLADYEYLYDLNKKTFEVSKFIEQLLVWTKNSTYSHVLKSLIFNLCSFDPQKRMTSQELWDLLSKHEQNIAKKTNFFIDNAPESLHLSVKQLFELHSSTSAQTQILLKQYQLALQSYYQSKIK